MGISQVYGFLREQKTLPRASVRSLCTGVRARRRGEIMTVMAILKHNILQNERDRDVGNVGNVRRWKVMTLLECTCMGIRYSPLERRGAREIDQTGQEYYRKVPRIEALEISIAPVILHPSICREIIYGVCTW